MEAVKLLEDTKLKIESISEAGLSFHEQEIIKFLKKELNKELILIYNFNKNFDVKRWEHVISNFFQLLQRTNIIYSFIMRPEIMTTLMNSKIYDIVDEVVTILSYSVNEAIMKIKSNLKEIGIESITVNISANPPSITISMVMK
jgi:hypothetical protein